MAQRRVSVVAFVTDDITEMLKNAMQCQSQTMHTDNTDTVAGIPGTLNCGRPARVPGAATVVSFIGLGVVSAGQAGGGGSAFF